MGRRHTAKRYRVHKISCVTLLRAVIVGFNSCVVNITCHIYLYYMADAGISPGVHVVILFPDVRAIFSVLRRPASLTIRLCRVRIEPGTLSLALQSSVRRARFS